MLKEPSIQLSTPPPNKFTLLSLPLHLKTLKSYFNRARYSHIIRYPNILPNVVNAVIKKLISYMDLLEEGIEILQQENTKLRNSAIERRAKKKNKQVVLSTRLVLTTKSAKALIAAKAAVEETKQQAKNTRERLRKNKRDAAIIA